MNALGTQKTSLAFVYSNGSVSISEPLVRLPAGGPKSGRLGDEGLVHQLSAREASGGRGPGVHHRQGGLPIRVLRLVPFKARKKTSDGYLVASAGRRQPAVAEQGPRRANLSRRGQVREPGCRGRLPRLRGEHDTTAQQAVEAGHPADARLGAHGRPVPTRCSPRGREGQRSHLDTGEPCPTSTGPPRRCCRPLESAAAGAPRRVRRMSQGSPRRVEKADDLHSGQRAG